MKWKLVEQDLKRVEVLDLENLMSRFIMGPAEVSALTRGGMINTDDNALIEFSTPKTLFAETENLNAKILEPYRQPAGKYFE